MNVSDAEKKKVWDAYRAGQPIRVPVVWGINPRVVLLDEAWNPNGYTFQEYFADARVAVDVQLKFLEYQVEYLNHYSDSPTSWPEKYDFYVDVQNIYDSAYFGGVLEFRDGQMPDIRGHLAGAGKERIFETDIDRPMDNPFVRASMTRWEDLKREVERTSYRGIELGLRPLGFGFDGPLTVATNLRGGDLYVDLVDDPDYVARVLGFITRGAIIRNRAIGEHFGVPAYQGKLGGIADDSVQLISTEMYRRIVLSHHRQYLSQWSVQGPHSIHLCGDATRHFAMIRDELNVKTFDTGFPVDHGRLRRELGPDVTIQGGPAAGLLSSGSPDDVRECTRAILQSGVKDGGKFLLREGNNLPPKVPESNLRAMWDAALQWGWFDGQGDES